MIELGETTLESDQLTTIEGASKTIMAVRKDKRALNSPNSLPAD